MVFVDIVRVKALCKDGQLKAYTENGGIFLKDTVSDEVVRIGDATAQDVSLMVERLKVDKDGIDMSLSGAPARLFMAGLVNLFKHSGAENFLTLTVKDNKNEYAITVQDCEKGTAPAQKLAELTARVEKAEADREHLK